MLRSNRDRTARLNVSGVPRIGADVPMPIVDACSIPPVPMAAKFPGHFVDCCPCGSLRCGPEPSQFNKVGRVGIETAADAPKYFRVSQQGDGEFGADAAGRDTKLNKAIAASIRTDRRHRQLELGDADVQLACWQRA